MFFGVFLVKRHKDILKDIIFCLRLNVQDLACLHNYIT